MGEGVAKLLVLRARRRQDGFSLAARALDRLPGPRRSLCVNGDSLSTRSGPQSRLSGSRGFLGPVGCIIELG